MDVEVNTGVEVNAGAGLIAGAEVSAGDGLNEGAGVNAGAGANAGAGGDDWDKLCEDIGGCRLCELCDGRTNVVVGRGNRNAPILFIGEGPGESEDLQGLPFVGRAGKLLDYALCGLSFPEDSYYIANIVKCRPPNNRAPQDDEAEKCLPFLRRQTRLINPKILVCLGAIALKHIVGREHKITQVRGKWFERKNLLILPTFHPAALLRDENKKADVWNDLKEVRRKLNEI